MSTPDPYAKAPQAVRDAAARNANIRPKRIASAALFVGALVGALALPGIAHDAFGASEMASAAMLFAGLSTTFGASWWVSRTFFGQAVADDLVLKRYQTLADLGLSAPVATPDEQTTAVDKLCDRIVALAGPREAICRAVEGARARSKSLCEERRHVDGLLADPKLGAHLEGVCDRIDGEVSRIRAGLAEIYAGLLSLEPAAGPTAELDEAVSWLAAEVEVASRSPGVAARAAARQAAR